MTNTNDQKTVERFKIALIRAGLLGQYSGSIIAIGNSGEDILFTKWHAMARAFIHKNRRVRVVMRAKHADGGLWMCSPEVTIRDY
jgi:hypothetical protein